MKSLLVAIATSSAFSAPTFSEWAAKQHKGACVLPYQYILRGPSFTAYAKEELVLRRAIYAANVFKIEAHNAEATAGQHTWTMGVNKFADLTAAEFGARMTGGYRPRPTGSKRRVGTSLSQVLIAPAADVNWTAKGAVTAVKDQGKCGSCWAFSATGSMESAVFLATGELLGLSEQELNSCSDAWGNGGCEGGRMDFAFQYIIDNKGIASEKAYPYTSGTTGVDGDCVTPQVAVATIGDYTDVPAGSDTALIAALNDAPVSVAIEADEASFQFYLSGVMNAPCGTALNHGVLAVGYGTDADAGDNPYGQCGIQMDPSFPIDASILSISK